MMKSTMSVLAVTLAIAATPAAAQMGSTPDPTPPQAAKTPAASNAGKIQISKKASKAFTELQKAVNANDVANIPAKVEAAKAVAETKEDRYAIGKLQLDAARAAKNSEAAVLAADYIAASGFLPNSQVAGLYNSLGVEFFNAKNQARATAMFQKALAADPNNAETLRLMTESGAAGTNPAQALAAMKTSLDQARASGQKLPEDSYKRAIKIAYDARSPEAVTFGRDWIAAYPGPDSWHNALAIYRNLNHPDGATAFDVLRLARLTNSLSGTGDYHTYAYEAANQGNYGEAKSLMAEAIAAGKVKASDPIIAEIQSVLRSKSAPSAAELAAAEKGAKVPTAYLHVGDRYYGAGNYAKAAELYKAALAHGADANLANLRTGEALLQAGDKAGATAAFNAVQGPLADIAKFWLVYANRTA